ncbi:GntR family transcriptional regulator [Microbacterium sp. ZW T5_45]|uniref:GntR family transcriptional regulator n=1 Tax=Microbacterium sp. ZW T5_45 TaxID=3378080 RepID=UPI0038551F54
MRGTDGPGAVKVTLAERVFEDIGARILNDEYPPGHRIRDLEVAEELHVSRTPVREALQRLERLGLVVVYPSRYTEVTSVTAEIMAQTLEFAGFQAGIVARLAATRATPLERQQVAMLIERLADAEPGTDAARARWDVFAFLGERTGNTPLRSMLSETGLVIRRNLSACDDPHMDHDRIQQLCGELREALNSGDGDAAERAARALHGI